MPRKVENIEIWRAANQLVKRFGEDAGLEAALRADAALELGDRFNFNLWTQINGAVSGLQRQNQKKRDKDQQH